MTHNLPPCKSCGAESIFGVNSNMSDLSADTTTSWFCQDCYENYCFEIAHEIAQTPMIPK